MFCPESCEHGCSATPLGNGAPPQTQQQAQQQYNMCYAPLSMPAQELGGKCDAEPPRVGMCLVTEGPEGLSIDCNVPLPNSFNLDEYRKQMVCSCCPAMNGGGYIDGFCLPQQTATAIVNPIQTPACSFQCQCCPVEAASSSGFDTRSMQAATAPALGSCPLPSIPARTFRQEQPITVAQKAPGTALVPQIFYLAAPTLAMSDSEGSCYPQDQQPAYLYNLIPMQSMSPAWCPQAVSVVPVAQPQLLPQQQNVTNPAQNSQLPMQQLMRYDLNLPRQQAEIRRERDRDRFCCDSPTPLPFAFQLYAPAHAVTFNDPPATAVSPSLAKRDVPSAIPSPDPLTIPSVPKPPTPPSQNPAAPLPPSPDNAGLPRARSDSTKCTGSCLRSKELWESSGAAQSHAPCPSAVQHGAGNICMKCGNCWHCPRCSCSNCFWHPGLVRAPPRDSRQG